MARTNRDLSRYLAEDWIPALKLGALIDTIENLDDGPTVNIEVSGVPIGEARTINFVGGSAVDLGDWVINYTPPGSGGGTAEDFQILASDPVAPADGEVWYNSTAEKFRFRQNGVTIEIPTSGSGIATSFQILASDPGSPADGDVWYNSTDGVFRFYQDGVIAELGGGSSGIATSFQVLASDPGTPSSGDVWYNSTTKLFKWYSDGETLVAGATGTGDTMTNKGATVFATGASSTFQSGATQTFDSGATLTLADESVVSNQADETFGAGYEGSFASGSAVTHASGSTDTYSSGSTLTHDNESIISNQADETFGAGYEGTYASGSSNTHQSGSSTVFESGSNTDFQAGSNVDFTGAVITGLPSGGQTFLTVSSAVLSTSNVSDMISGAYRFSEDVYYWIDTSTGAVYKYDSSIDTRTTVGTTTATSRSTVLYVDSSDNIYYAGVISSTGRILRMTSGGVESTIYNSGLNAGYAYFGHDLNDNMYGTFTGSNILKCDIVGTNSALTNPFTGTITRSRVVGKSSTQTYFIGDDSGNLASFATLSNAGTITKIANADISAIGTTTYTVSINPSGNIVINSGASATTVEADYSGATVLKKKLILSYLTVITSTGDIVDTNSAACTYYNDTLSTLGTKLLNIDGAVWQVLGRGGNNTLHNNFIGFLVAKSNILVTQF